MQLKNVIHILLLIFLINDATAQIKTPLFKTNQLKNSRVKDAYDTKWEDLKADLKKHTINPEDFDIYLRAFKQEKELQVWMKNKDDAKYQLFKTYEICSSSGTLGPKRKEGDGQVPEGFYKIDLFNPKSDYYLSMRINYPNASDIILKEGSNAGGAIMLHGNCVTIGCIPITDDKIKELYILCLEAKSRDKPVYIDIFPLKFTTANMKYLEENYPKSKIEFWNNLRHGYNYFEDHHKLQKIDADKKGVYYFVE